MAQEVEVLMHQDRTAPSDAIGDRWTVIAVDIPTVSAPHPDKPGWTIHTPGEPRAYAVMDRNWQNEQARYPTHADAVDDAKRRNDDDVEHSRDQDPIYVQRRRLLRGLGETFWVRYGDGPLALRWPNQPGRYAMLVWSERYSDSFWETSASLDEVKLDIARGEVERVVDLDTGEDIGFSVDVRLGD